MSGTRPSSISTEEYRAWLADNGPARSKYGNKRAEVDGYVFDSIAEAAYYRDELRVRELAGDIYDLTLQPRFDLVVNGHRITRYTADFSYRDRGGALHVVDVKSGPTKTRDYVIRRKLMMAIHGIEVEEIEA